MYIKIASPFLIDGQDLVPAFDSPIILKILFFFNSVLKITMPSIAERLLLGLSVLARIFFEIILLCDLKIFIISVFVETFIFCPIIFKAFL